MRRADEREYDGRRSPAGCCCRSPRPRRPRRSRRSWRGSGPAPSRPGPGVRGPRDTSMRHHVWTQQHAPLDQAHQPRPRPCRNQPYDVPITPQPTMTTRADEVDRVPPAQPRVRSECEPARTVTRPPTRATAVERWSSAARSTAARMPAAASGDHQQSRRRPWPVESAAARCPTPRSTPRRRRGRSPRRSLLGAQAAFAGPHAQPPSVGDLELGEDRGQVVAYRLR